MGTSYSKTQFINLLNETLNDHPRKDEILSIAKSIIPADSARAQLSALTSNKVYQAYHTYASLNPSAPKPNIAHLVDWLLHANLIGRVLDAEGRLNQIKRTILTHDLSNPQSSYSLSWSELIDLLFYATLPASKDPHPPSMESHTSLELKNHR